MRKVLRSSAEVFHYFANNVQPEGVSGNVRFDGTTLYSYRLPIARRFGAVGESVQTVLIHEPNSTMTTNSHIRSVRYAFSGLMVKILYAFSVTSLNDHMRHARLEVEAALRTIAKSTSLTRDGRMARLLDDIKNYNEAAKVLAAELGVTPELIKAPEFSEAEMSKMRAEYKAERARVVAAKKAAIEERRADYEARITDWKAGASNRLYSTDRDFQVALRVYENEVQTSMGARIPVSHAKRLWPVIEAVRAGTGTFEPGAPVGVYKLTRINKDGSVVVGCHNIPYSEIEYVRGIIFKEGEA